MNEDGVEQEPVRFSESGISSFLFSELLQHVHTTIFTFYVTAGAQTMECAYLLIRSILQVNAAENTRFLSMSWSRYANKHF